MDYGHVLFATMACLIMMLAGVFGKPREFSESTDLTSGERRDLKVNHFYCMEMPLFLVVYCSIGTPCKRAGRHGVCRNSVLTCYCHLPDEDEGSKYLQLANEMPTEGLRRTFVEKMEQKNNEQ